MAGSHAERGNQGNNWHDMKKPSFPRSAWERIVGDALRHLVRRGASEWRVPTQSVGTREASEWRVPTRSVGTRKGTMRMRIADVIGTVTLNRAHPSMMGASLKLVVPLGWDNLAGQSNEPMEEIAVYDELGAGVGSRIAISEGREAAMPFHPELKPLDAYNAAILDTLDYDRSEIA